MPENKELPEEEVRDEVGGDVKEPGGLVRFLKFLLPVVLLSLAGGGYLAYTKYTDLAEGAVSLGIDFGFSEAYASDVPVEYGEFATIEDLLINPAGSGGKRFLVVSLGLEVRSGAVIAELAKRDIVVRDAVLRVLSRRTSEELASIDRRAEIKDEIIAELNGILQEGEIDRLYFTQYLLQ